MRIIWAIPVTAPSNSSVGMQTVNAVASLGLKAPVLYSAGNTPFPVVIADLNGDGRPDLVVGEIGGSNINVLLGNGDGSFQIALTTAASTTRSIAVGDFNGDGKTDLALADNATNTVTILLGNGDGTFRAQVTYMVGNNPTAIAVGDFNGDGIPDLVTSNLSDSTVSVLLGKGDGTFGPMSFFQTQGAFYLVVGDFNGDGKADLAIAGYSEESIGIYLGNGDGTFHAGATYSCPSPNQIVVADFDGDGKADLAVTEYSQDVTLVLLGNGDGSFQTVSTSGGGSLAVGDINGDGKLDLVGGPSAVGFSCTTGTGTGPFQAGIPYTTPLTNDGVFYLAVGDFNGDGKSDVAVTYNDEVHAAVLLGGGVPAPDLTIEVSAAAQVSLRGKSEPLIY